MAQEIEIEFGEIPNTYHLLKDKTTVLKRKVLFEKTEITNLKANPDSDYSKFFNAFVKNQILTGALNLEDIVYDNTIRGDKPKVLFEKDMLLIANKRQIKKRRSDILQKMHHVKTKSNSDDIIIDITSFENIDFNKPCTKEEKLELFQLLDHYIYQDCIDEINCEIKENESAGADSVRLDYGRQYNSVALDIFKSFSEHQTERLPDNYNEFIDNKLEQFFSRTLTRRVLFEKVGFPTFKVMSKYETYLKSIKEKDEFWNLKKEYRKSKELEIEQELNEIQADLHRRIHGNGYDVRYGRKNRISRNNAF